MDPDVNPIKSYLSYEDNDYPIVSEKLNTYDSPYNKFLNSFQLEKTPEPLKISSST